LLNAASHGDQAAKAYAGYIVHTAGREALEQINDGSGAASLVFLAIGLPEVAFATGVVNTVASFALSVDDILSGNIAEGVIGIAGVVAGYGVSKAIGNSVENAIDNGLNITVGKNHQFYSFGRRGALNAWDAIERQILGDVASGIYGRLAPEVASQIINSAKDAYKEVIKQINEEN
jgi:hypothetical protein